jgi:hypothetical protein
MIEPAERVHSELMFRAYLLSFLARQRLLLLEQRFGARYPHHWLVWEPGSWKAPPANASVAETKLPMKTLMPPRAEPGDALCFELAVKPERKEPVRIGRAEESELVISDATVSREHCTLRLDNGQWKVRACEAVKSLKVDGKALAAGAEATLAPGQQLDLGDVKLTLLDPRRFYERVASQAAKL